MLHAPSPADMARAQRWIMLAAAAMLIALATVVLFAAARGHAAGEPWSVDGLIAELSRHTGANVLLFFWTFAVLLALSWGLDHHTHGLLEYSMTDPATGLPNRRLFEWAIDRAVGALARDPRPLSLLIVDVDGLKAINDQGGHGAGDLALEAVVHSLRGACRAEDVAARWGGDEFAILAQRTSAQGAVELARRIRANLRRAATLPEYASLPFVTVSIGVADVAAAGPSPGALFFVADGALYRAKTLGRDRVEVAEPFDRDGRRLAARSAAERLSSTTLTGLPRASGASRATDEKREIGHEPSRGHQASRARSTARREPSPAGSAA